MPERAQEIETLLNAFAPEKDVRPLLARENIFVGESFANKEQAIQFLCGNLGANGRTEHPFELEEDVWQREEIVTTGVGFGVAIPHTKSQDTSFQYQHCTLITADRLAVRNGRGGAGDYADAAPTKA